ncbi:hypothetical protein pEaSNUABM56_00211 [Erwinia phage pEa_SNUABM_56]|uniref:Putative thymidylate synthase n=1 Tax=Erwinia phage pEp_SNUABM_01 TaxID=2601643 RepID=A0A5J6DBN5_9CAUD|nr:putative thymidylate synthase [Erwinia phage pEp_SNUABM_01]QEQ94986.1 putative thymidylate synthase [Erwinia phage pEp_SNUABM_01]UYL84912.1 hypothetical protein pEaSNUABM55_00139 [Erwinia phage pEa_SNUABM_55]UYL85231.1 hypothetical protein pEaSNUABM56_00211 [Erwinia phage pEa_SNUABM_56]
MTNLMTATIVADSISEQGVRITTFELEYPRIIHSEFMTHRLFSRNAMSSRAIPIATMIQQVMNDPAMPVRFGANQAGMQDKGGNHDALINAGYTAQEWWQLAGISAAKFAEGFADAGYHKQIGNRLLEPFQRMKTVLTATEFENFWWLRVDKDADPTIYALAEIMHKSFKESTPELLKAGQWHTPYVYHSTKADDSFHGYYVVGDDDWPVELTEQEALAISASCCAQVSYRRLNNTKDKALDIYEKLLSGNKVHASPFEHQATPLAKTIDDSWKGRYLNNHDDPNTWEKGITHVDRDGNFWSGNLRGWSQHRQSVPNNVVRG